MSEHSKHHREHQEELRQMLTEIVRVMANKPGLEVTTELSAAKRLECLRNGQNPDDLWFRQTEYDPVTGEVVREHVRIPEKVLEGEEMPAMGIAAHEGAHSAITRLMEAGADKYADQLGFNAVLMALEERPTDQEVRAKFSEAGKWLDLARCISSEKSDEGKKETLDKTKVSKLAQICNLLVYAPHSKNWGNYDTEVLAKYEEIRSDVEFVEGCLPERDADEAERVKKAKIRLDVTVKKIWPKIKDFVDADMSQNMMEQILASIMSGELSLEGESSGQPSATLELPADIAAELSKKLPKSKSGQDLSKLPKIQLSPAELDALKKALAKLPDQIQKEIQDKAQQKIEQVEQEIVDKHGPKLEERPQTLQEKRQEIADNLRKHQEEAAEKERIEIDKQINSEREKVRREQAAQLEQKSAYEMAYDQVRDMEKTLYRELEEIFHPITKTKTRIKNTGPKINLPAVFRWEAAKEAGQNPAPRVFESTERPNKKDYAITLMLDLSGSMSGEKIQQTFLAVILLAECLNRLGLKLEIVGFQDELIVFKKFNEKLDGKIRHKINGMPKEVTGNNATGHNNPNYNDDGPCLTEAAEGLMREPVDNRFLIVLSDGKPEGRRSNANDLQSAITKINKASKINLIALGLGSGTEHVKKFYPTAIPNIQANRLGEVLPDLIKDILQNPKKYRIR